MRLTSYGSRRCSTWLALAIVASGLLVACAEAPAPPPPPPPPPLRNVLLIVVDTLRADHLGLYGYDRNTSPNLDRWAGKGVIFERALTTSPWTVPAFGSLLTGVLPSTHGGGLLVEGASDIFKRMPIRAEVPSFVERLREEGFATFAIVGNPFLSRDFGLARGFEAYAYRKRHRGGDEVVDRGLEWISHRGSEERFFALMHFMEPHLPHVAPEPFLGLFTDDAELRKLRVLKERRARGSEYSEEERLYFVGRYDEEIAYIDYELGRLFDGLGDRWTDTLVILTADHGEEVLDHDSFDHGHTLMQELLHIPLIVWAPHLQPLRVSTPVSIVDIAPTVLEALGILGVDETHGDGVSLMRSIGGAPVEESRPLVAEFMLFGEEQKALLRWPYKLVLHPTSGERWLVNLERDPLELDDLSTEFPERADRMEAELLRRIEIAGLRGGDSEAVELAPEVVRELEAIGYVN